VDSTLRRVLSRARRLEFYRRKFRGMRLRHWEDVPPTTRKELARAHVPLGRRTDWISWTGGPGFSILPGRVGRYFTLREAERCAEALRPLLPEGRAAFMLEPQGLVFHTLLQAYAGSDPVVLTRGETARKIGSLGELDVVVTYPTYMEYMKRIGADAFRRCVLYGEMLVPERGERLGVEYVNIYGFDEAGVVAAGRHYLRTLDCWYVECIDGKIAVTSLFPSAFPLVRYMPGDFGECRNGRLLVLGRFRDQLVLERTLYTSPTFSGRYLLRRGRLELESKHHTELLDVRSVVRPRIPQFPHRRRVVHDRCYTLSFEEQWRLESR